MGEVLVYIRTPMAQDQPEFLPATPSKNVTQEDGVRAFYE